MLHKPKRIVRNSILFFNRIRFRLFFKRKPGVGEYCNSKRITVHRVPAMGTEGRPYLAIVRCGSAHWLKNDHHGRNFDIALNFYANPDATCADQSEYLYVGGINKYQGAYQFLTEAVRKRYEGFMFLDDDLEITYSQLSRFMSYCSAQRFALAQPSLSKDSYFSHRRLVNAAGTGWRPVGAVEVMCPFFSRQALEQVIGTFNLSYSTWGLDTIWPRVLDIAPVVVDEFTIRHVKPMASSGAFYRYMRRIGVSPRQELTRLKRMFPDKCRG